MRIASLLKRPIQAAVRPDLAQPRPSGFVAVRSLPLLYVNMPKSGCTTIKNILHRLDSGSFLDDPLTIHRRTDLFLRAGREPEEFERRLGRDLVFTFVRHPLKRAYSCFNEKIHFQTKYSFGKVRKRVTVGYGAHFVADPTADRHRENFKAFLRFSLDSFNGKTRQRRDPHWCPQSMVLNSTRRWRAIDFIGRMESFDAHLKALLGLAGVACDFPIPRLNEGPPSPWPYETMLDDEVRELGQRLFAQDLKLLGYVI
jgi:hypothetical protein